MRTTFALLRELTGLTSDEAARLLDVRLDTVKSWNSGRNPAPDGVMLQMKDLWRKISEISDEVIEKIELALATAETPPEVVEYGLPTSDAEAQEVLGLPTLSAAERVAAIVVAADLWWDVTVKIVRRGATDATRQAILSRIQNGEVMSNEERSKEASLALAQKLGLDVKAQPDGSVIAYVPAYMIHPIPSPQKRVKAWVDATKPQTLAWPPPVGKVTYMVPIELLDEPVA